MTIFDQCAEILAKLRDSSRPVILVGSGVRTAGALPQLHELVRRLGVPVVTAWAVDAFPTDDPHFAGQQGTIGDVGGNAAVQEADFLLVLGSRLCIRQVSHNWKAFAPQAFKAWVDVDPAELAKPTVKADLPVCCDVRVFLDELNRQLFTPKPVPGFCAVSGLEYVYGQIATMPSGYWRKWLQVCRERWLTNPVVQPRHREWRGKINPYHFLETLWSKLADDDVVVCGNACATIMTMQTAVIRGTRRLLSNSGAASMGWCLPAAIGAAAARPGKRVICITGDGSIMQCLGELATIAHNRLPIKIFVLNNGGYATIRASQRNLLGREVGAGESSGVGFPDMKEVGKVMGVGGLHLEDRTFACGIDLALTSDGPILGVVDVDPDQPQEPRLRSRRLPDGSMQTAWWEDFA